MTANTPVTEPPPPAGRTVTLSDGATALPTFPLSLGFPTGHGHLTIVTLGADGSVQGDPVALQRALTALRVPGTLEHAIAALALRALKQDRAQAEGREGLRREGEHAA